MSLNNTVTSQLHGFCDASERAFTAVIYLRSVCVDGTVEVTLVAAKTRVSPIKKQSRIARCCDPGSPYEKCNFFVA